jgi:hypothetical protein
MAAPPHKSCAGQVKIGEPFDPSQRPTLTRPAALEVIETCE